MMQTTPVISAEHDPSTARKPLRCVVIGGGKISAQHLATLTTIADLEVAAVCDRSPALARFTAERYGVARWYVDHREMLARESADVVHVLTPPATHEALVTDALESDHHVIVEKPVTLSHESFRRLWDLASAKGLRLVENHNYRFNRPIEQLHRLVSSGRIGDVEEVEVRMALNVRAGGRYADAHFPHPSHSLPAGVIHEFISHLAYLLLHFLPDGAIDAVDVLRAAWRNHGGPPFTYDDLDVMLIAGSTHGRIRFTSRQWPDCLAVDVRGSAGAASAELFNPRVSVVTPRAGGQHLTPLVNSLAGAGGMLRAGFGNLYDKIRNRTAYEGLDCFLRATYASLSDGSDLPVGYAQMDATSRLIDAMLAVENRV